MDALTDAHRLAASRRFLTAEDVDDIQDLVRQLPDRLVRIVDLGAGSGTTALAVFSVRRRAIKVWTVDKEIVALDWARKNLEAFGKLDVQQWEPILAAAAAAADLWRLDYPKRLVDLLLHDAGHEESDVRADLAAWLPLLRAGGLIWVHDYLPMPGGEHYPGVGTAVDDLVRRGVLAPLAAGGIGFAGRKR